MICNNFNPLFLDDSDINFVMKTVRDAVSVWESRSCVKFPYKTTQSQYVDIVNGVDCSSFTGHQYTWQTLSLHKSNASSCILVSAQSNFDDCQLFSSRSLF